PTCTCKHCPHCGKDKQRSHSSSPTPHKKFQPEFSYNNEEMDGKETESQKSEETLQMAPGDVATVVIPRQDDLAENTAKMNIND
uniref:Metallothionein n=1 Tax=Romanomermis culicivorax TaxID=13658 RepID=A0A915J1E3_ROMCU